MKRLQRIELRITFIFGVVVLALAIALTSFLTMRSNDTLRVNMANMMSANSRQLELNIERYFQEIENSVALLYADESYYAYDDTDESLSDYDRIQAADAIQDRIVDLGIMQNFADFGIIYANDVTVGWISQVTDAMESEGGLYAMFADTLVNERGDEGWSSGLNDNYNRIYYAKRLNQNAIAIASFYGQELATVFEFSEELSAMTVRLVNGKNDILYSSDQSELGSQLPEEVAALTEERYSGSAIDNNYLVSTNTLDNGWRVICSVPTEQLLANSKETQQEVYAVIVLLIAIIIALGILIYRRMDRTMSGVFDDLSDQATHDQLTGLLQKQVYRAAITEDIQEYPDRSARVFLMLDMDHFKLVNDRLGHAKGDDVLIRMSAIIRDVFGDDCICGRLGGDEFAVYQSFTSIEPLQVKKILQRRMEKVQSRFENEFKEERESCQISVSAGAYITDVKARVDFEIMYRKADAALYDSKRTGRNKTTYTFSGEGYVDEE